jgi:hypothetical protein
MTRYTNMRMVRTMTIRVVASMGYLNLSQAFTYKSATTKKSTVKTIMSRSHMLAGSLSRTQQNCIPSYSWHERRMRTRNVKYQ